MLDRSPFRKPPFAYYTEAMALQTLAIGNWTGGQAQDDKEGVPNSSDYFRHLDWRKSPTTLTPLPATRLDSLDSGSTIFDDLPINGIQLPSGKKVFIDLAGGVYYRAVNGTWSKLAGDLGTPAFGMVYNPIHDTIYIPTLSTLSAVTNADGAYGGSPAISADHFTANQDQARTGHGNTYTTTAAINEGATHKLTFDPAYDPLHSVKLWVTTKGTGDVRVVVHDTQDKELGQATLTAAQMTNGQQNEWVFPSDLRLRAGANGSEYHIHVYNPSGGTATTIGSGTSNDLETGEYATFASRFVSPQNGFHPVLEFFNFYAFGNGNYLTVWEPISQTDPSNTEWIRNRLQFPLGYEVTSMAIYSEYIAIACEKRSASDTDEFQEGKIYFWGGTSQLVDFTLDVPEGAPYSLFSKGNRLYWFAGGSWFTWAGDQPEEIFEMPFTDGDFSNTNYYNVNYPYMMAVKNDILMAGFPSETNNPSIEHGIYTFGNASRYYPESVGYSHSISTGARFNTGTHDLRIGMVKNFGSKTFIGWRDDDNDDQFGIDIIDNASDPYEEFEWRSLWFDNERQGKDKLADKMVIVFDEPLPADCTITPRFRISRADTFSDAETPATAGDSEVELHFSEFGDKTRYREIQLSFTGTSTSGNVPKIKKIEFQFDDLVTEESR